MTLRWKVALALAGVALVATAAVGLIGYRSTSQRLLDEIDQAITSATVSLVSRPGPSRVPDRGLLEVYEVRLLDRNGRIEGSSFEARLPVDEAALAAAGAGGIVVRQTVEFGDERYRLHTFGLPSGAFQVARSLEEVDRVLDDVRQRTILLVVLVSVGAAVIGSLIAGTVVRPLRRLTAAAEEVGSSGELDVAVPGGGTDEVGRLGTAFQQMLDALGRSRTEQRRLVQDAGHELRTPLTSLRTNLAVLRRHPGLGPETKARLLDDLDGEVSELTQLVNELVAAASGDVVDEPAQAIDLGPVADAIAERVGRRRSRDIHVDVRSDGTVLAPPAGLERAISNLVDNACKFDPSGAAVDVVVDGGDLTVLDRGPGIPERELASVFDRFHRSDAARAMPGSGLGLSIVRDVVEAHGGSVHAANRPDGGAAVGFTLPMHTS